MLLFIRKKPDLLWSGLLAAIIATIIINLLKHSFNLPRPPSFFEKSEINIIGQAIYSHSFPSGHTATIFTLAGILIFYFRSNYYRFSILILAFFTGLSRIAVGVHWPTDVIAGAGIGILSAISGVFIVSESGWNRNKPVQLTIGLILILCDLYLLVLYDCKYTQALYFKRIIAMAVLIVGIKEYYFLLKET
jgi:membrane-associated phospholipid phosphatase